MSDEAETIEILKNRCEELEQVVSTIPALVEESMRMCAELADEIARQSKNLPGTSPVLVEITVATAEMVSRMIRKLSKSAVEAAKQELSVLQNQKGSN